MPVFKAPVDDTLFILNDVLGIERYSNLSGFADATPDVVEAIVQEAAKFSEEVLFPLNQDSCARVTKNEMAVAITEVEMTRTDLRADDQNRSGSTVLNRVDRCLKTEGCGTAGHVHVIGETVNAECLLHFNGNRWIGPLQVGAGNDYGIDILCRLTRLLKGLTASSHSHFALHRGLLVAAIGNIGLHAFGIENAILVDHMSALDAGRFLDKRGGRWLQRRHIAIGDGVCVLRVEQFNVLVEGFDQFVIINGCWRCVETGPANNGFNHANPTS